MIQVGRCLFRFQAGIQNSFWGGKWEITVWCVFCEPDVLCWNDLQSGHNWKDLQSIRAAKLVTGGFSTPDRWCYSVSCRIKPAPCWIDDCDRPKQSKLQWNVCEWEGDKMNLPAHKWSMSLEICLVIRLPLFSRAFCHFKTGLRHSFRKRYSVEWKWKKWDYSLCSRFSWYWENGFG